MSLFLYTYGLKEYILKIQKPNMHIHQNLNAINVILVMVGLVLILYYEFVEAMIIKKKMNDNLKTVYLITLIVWMYSIIVVNSKIHLWICIEKV